MTRKIFRSTFLTSVIVLAASLILFLDVLYNYFENTLTAELADEAHYLAGAVMRDPNGTLSDFSGGKKRLTLIAPDGTVIADSAADADKMDNHAGREEFRKALADGEGSSVRYSATLTEKTVYYAKRLPDGSVLRLSTMQYTAAALLFGLMQPLAAVIAIAFVLSLILSKRAARALIAPINAIDPEHPEDADAYEELSPLLHKMLAQKRTIAHQIADSGRNREEFRLITENMNEGLLVINRSSELLSSNAAAKRLFGEPAPDRNVLTLNRSEGFREAVFQSLAGSRCEKQLLLYERTYRLIANPVFDGGVVIGAVILIIDVTETAHRELMRREFTANVSHELKTPLTSISGFAELLKNGGTPDATVVDFATSIYDEAQRLIALVSDIIKISELDESDTAFVSEEVELGAMCREIISRLSDAAAKKRVTLSLDGSAYVHGVRQILDEMVYNLVDNAIKYNREGGSVNIVIDADDAHTTLTVRDTGIGIAPAMHERVFERFFRIDKSRSKAEGGTGLGLSIVKHGALYHGAKIGIDSVPGKGTSITLDFPVKKS